MEQNTTKRIPRGRRAILWIAGIAVLLIAAVLIHYRGVHPIVTREYGMSAPQAADYTLRDAVLAGTDVRPTCGWHVLNLKIGGVPTPVLLHVRDTVAPTAEAIDREVALGIPLGPDAFVGNIRDADVVTLTFVEQPDFSREGEQTVRIRMKDRSGNVSMLSARVSVRATHPEVVWEAGSELPTVEAFLLDGVHGELEQPIDPESVSHVGSTRVVIVTDIGVRSESVLTVVDREAPRANGTSLLLLPDETVLPQDCAANVSDETDLSFAFVDEPDYNRRDVQTVTVRITDEGKNETDVQSKLLISGVRPKEIEARKEPLAPTDFRNDEGDVIDVPAFVPDVPGVYTIGIVANGVAQTVAVTVADTTAPEIAEKPLSHETTFFTGHTYEPEDFFEASDISDVTMHFLTAPDFDHAGEQTVSAVAEDAYGNSAVCERMITLSDDVEAPEIYGVIDRMCYVNEPIAYLKEVFAQDNADGRVEVTVESEVLTYQTGRYRVVYHATDVSGNEATRECTFQVIDQTVTEEEIHAIAEKVMDEITTPDMNKAEILKAIFDYVQKQIVYTNGSNHNYTDWRKAAYDGFTYGIGDCYNIYSVTRALLDETDIPYLSVERVKAYPWHTRHYWVHVNAGTGWYVFDPTWTPRHRFNCFMWTERQCTASRNYWKYDTTRYPPLATEPFDPDAVAALENRDD